MGYVKLDRNDFKSHYEKDRLSALQALEGGIKAGELRLNNGSRLDHIFESCTGRTFEDLYNARRSRFESADFVGLSDFSIAVGLFLMDEAMRGFKKPDFIADRLITKKKEAISLTMPQKIPYFPVPTDDNNYRKQEGKPYNRVGAASGFIESTPPEDNGFIIEATREVLRDDKTGGGIAESIYRQGEGLGIAREKDLLKTAFGTQGVWKFGKQNAMPTTQYNTYAASGAPYVNSAANSLVSWKSINTALQLYATMTDPVTGQLMGMPTSLALVVPYALAATAQNIKTALQVSDVDNQANSGTVRMTFNNPLTNSPIAVDLDIVTNQFVKSVTSSDTTWYLIDKENGFVLNNGWDEEQMEQGQESNAYFEANILYRQRFSYNQKAYPWMPWRNLKQT